MKIYHIFYVMLILAGACDLPRDSQSSWEAAKKTGLKVGIVVNPPFCYNENGSLKGSEVQLLREFARNEGLEISFEVGSETGLVERLEDYDLQVLAGGFKNNTIWKKKVGLTTTYMDKRVMLIPRGENNLLRHLETYLLKKRDGLSQKL